MFGCINLNKINGSSTSSSVEQQSTSTLDQEVTSTDDTVTVQQSGDPSSCTSQSAIPVKKINPLMVIPFQNITLERINDLSCQNGSKSIHGFTTMKQQILLFALIVRQLPLVERYIQQSKMMHSHHVALPNGKMLQQHSKRMKTAMP